MASTTSSAQLGGTSSAAQASNGRIDLSLDRIKTLLQKLGSPQDKFPVIHIAGTNGKGSTSAYLDGLLNNVVGVSTGRFNSPHLVDEQDCCRLNGQVISKDVWDIAGQKVFSADSEADLKSTPFELLVARAFTSFSSLPANIAPSLLIVEVGLGGRLDATNVFSPRNVLASVICPVDKDHEAILGSEITSIAKEKAGIIRQGGLCVVADQRRLHDVQSTNTEVELTSLRMIEAENQMFGEHAGAILDTIRHVTLERGARLAKAYVPWASLAPLSLQFEGIPGGISNRIQRPLASMKTRYTPTLFPSVLPSTPTHLVARTGDPVVSGHAITLPATRAALTGACTALQTLFSIARDEPPSAFGAAGGDDHEALKLQIAFAMREDRETALRIQRALDQVKWEGRCAWVQVKVPSVSAAIDSGPEETSKADTPADTAATEEKAEASEAMEVDEKEVSEPTETQVKESESGNSVAQAATSQELTLLVDGAHNPSSAQALRQYVELCLAPSSQEESPLTITWLMGFSKGKDIKGMLLELFVEENGAGKPIADSMAQLSISSSEAGHAWRQVQHRVGFLKFTTPVEGMPWVQSAEPDDSLAQLHELVSGGSKLNVVESKALDDLPSALAWASTRTASGASSDLVVLCGSLYLVGDLYRLQRSSQ